MSISEIAIQQFKVRHRDLDFKPVITWAAGRNAARSGACWDRAASSGSIFPGDVDVIDSQLSRAEEEHAQRERYRLPERKPVDPRAPMSEGERIQEQIAAERDARTRQAYEHSRSTEGLLETLIEEIRGLRQDLTTRRG